MKNIFTKFLVNTLSFFEYCLSRMQGKGQGSFSVQSEVATVAKFLSNNPSTLIDIGGNKGQYSAELRKKFPNSNIHIFEPGSSNFVVLNERFSMDSKVKINNLGIGSKEQTATLFADEDGSGMASLNKRKLSHFGIIFEHEETVKISTFFNYWENVLAQEIIEFVKIDIEGLELEALLGFQEAIKACRVVQFEFGGCNIDSRTYFQDFWYFFKHNNFKIYRITPFGPYEVRAYSEDLEHFTTTNYLAVNQRDLP